MSGQVLMSPQEQVFSDPNLVHLVFLNIQKYKDLALAAAVNKALQLEVSQSRRWRCISTQDLLAEVLRQNPLPPGHVSVGADVQLQHLACMLRGILLGHGASIQTLKLVPLSLEMLGINNHIKDSGAGETMQEASLGSSEWWLLTSTILTCAVLPYLSADLVPNLKVLEVHMGEYPSSSSPTSQSCPSRAQIPSGVVRCLARLPQLKVLRLNHLDCLTPYLVDLDQQPAPHEREKEEHGTPSWPNLLDICGGDLHPNDVDRKAAARCAGVPDSTPRQQQDQLGRFCLDLEELHLEEVELDNLFDRRKRSDSLFGIVGFLNLHHLQKLTMRWSGESQVHDMSPLQLQLTFLGLWALRKQRATLTHLDFTGTHFMCHPQFSGLPQHQAHASPQTAEMTAMILERAGPMPPAVTLLGDLEHLVTLNMANTRCIMPQPRDVIGMQAWQPKELEGLDLRNCHWVRQPDLLSALQFASNLQRLNISCCDDLDDDLMRLLPTYCPKLRELDVCYCSGMTRAGLMACCGAYPANQLTALGCSGFNTMCDADVTQLLQTQGTHLRMLGIGGCNQLTDDSLHAVAQHCPLLKSLYIQELPNISTAALLQLKQACPQLKEIEATGSEGLQDDAGKALLQQMPAVYVGDLLA